MPVQPGDTVRVHYTGTLADGTEFDSSAGREPLEFTVGAGDVIAGFDKAVAGMEPGDAQTVTIPAAEAYGEREEGMTLEVPRDQLPPDEEPSVGDHLMLSMEDGEQVPVRIASLDDDVVTLDANHPLAGEDLTFEITLEEIA